MAKETTITFKTSAELSDLIREVAFDMDKNRSEVIRACVLLSIDTVKATPSLVNRIQIEDRCK